ncbi:MAG: hypothetical protein LAO78_26370 [Acidobacteriia bacterium]|nr:hypothetical protein [Terriglobia bacterium]
MPCKFGTGLVLLFALTLAGAQSWAPLNNQPPFPAGTALLLTDSTVMVQQMTTNGFGTGNWWRLAPDSFGSYRNGTWSQLASMPAGYAPLYYASAVLRDGRVIIEGGEYNGNSGIVESTLGALYDPVSNSWSSVPPPPRVTQIGDASSVVLADGTFMLGPCCSGTAFLFNPSTLTWTFTGANKNDSNVEEGWTLLANGKVLTIDVTSSGHAEIYDPAFGSWFPALNTPVSLVNSGEIGPAVLLPDGEVLALGGNSNTALYNPDPQGWAVGPSLPSGYDVADGPAALIPNGHVLINASPGVFQPGTQFFEFNGRGIVAVPNPPGASAYPSFVGRLLVLPTGEILFTNQTNQVQLYTSSGTYFPQWQPVITSMSDTALHLGMVNYSVSGMQFNGLSQGAMYGDDAQAATNYPLVRITMNATGHVFYMRTHDHSTMGVATGTTPVSTLFDVPLNAETGDGTLQVVANGIPSNPVPVTMLPPGR